MTENEDLARLFTSSIPVAQEVDDEGTDVFNQVADHYRKPLKSFIIFSAVTVAVILVSTILLLASVSQADEPEGNDGTVKNEKVVNTSGLPQKDGR